MPVALITGGSAGLGLALATELAARGWDLVIDARNPDRLTTAADTLARPPGRGGGGNGPGGAESARGAGGAEDAPDAARVSAESVGGGLRTVVALAGDVSDAEHRGELAAAVSGGLDLLVNNASTIGPSPMPALAGYDLDELRRVYEVNLLAPLALIQLTLPALARNDGAIVNITSDAAVEPYEGWGGYGSSKAALDQLSAILGAEQKVRVYAFDPGDMRTELHQLAFPGEDISDRPEPVSVVPNLMKLIETKPVSGRYRA